MSRPYLAAGMDDALRAVTESFTGEQAAAPAESPAWCDEHALPRDECDCDIEARTLVVQRASEIRPRAVSWLWDGRVALGSLSLLAGREGLGKSTLVAWVVARITRGQLPGDLLGKPRSVIIAATEDSWEHTLVPRLMAADADLDRVLRVEVATAEGFTTGLHLPHDIGRVKVLADREGVALMVLDPIMSRLDSLDTHKDSEVRIALEPLVRMADEASMGIIGLIHLNKSSNDPLNAVMGSKAFTAVARSVSTVVADPEDEDDRRRLFGTVKNNLGPALPTSQVFTVETAQVGDHDGIPISTGQLAWHGEVDTSIKSAMSDPGIGEKSQTDEARDWLEDYLTMHPGTTRKEVMRDAAKADLSADSIKRAARKIGVQSKAEGFPRIARWSLPQSEQSEQPLPGESVLNAHTAPTGADLHKRETQSVQSEQWVQSVRSPESRAPTGAPTACKVCGEPSTYPIHPTCEEPIS
ncbi:AAA family ATPase [Brachybacterium tyrofermentans]|uniref:AAA family ATPase n=1 Tax=Brachybacterium tyrofermentans TaxID=47848 RepID=UPI003FD52FB5